MHLIEAKSILSATGGMNLTRGCVHGCIYCDSRSACYQMDHAFEDVAVKANALPLLEEALRRKRKRCMLGTGSMSDPYMPIPEVLESTRGALKLAHKYGFGFTLITKSALVLRDLDLLTAINNDTKCVVQMTLTTTNDTLCKKLEPNVSATSKRIHALCTLRDAGIPTVVWLSPFLPFINDTEANLRALLDACITAQVRGIICFGIGMTLREGNREYFYAQLDCLFPGMKERYIRTYGNQYQITSPNHARLMPLFHQICATHGILHHPEDVFAFLTDFDVPPEHEQQSLF